MDKRKFITILLVIIIVASLFVIVANFSSAGSKVNKNQNRIITTPESASAAQIGLVITENSEDGGSG